MLSTINKILELADNRTKQQCDEYKVQADKEIKAIRDAWNKKYQDVYDDIQTILLTNNEDIVKMVAKKYGKDQ